MDSTLVIKNSHTYYKNLLVIEMKYYAHAHRGTATHKEDNQEIPHAYESNMAMMVCVMIKRNGGSCMAIYLRMAMEMS